MRTVALYMPGDAEIDLLTRLGSEQDVAVRCIVDPTGAATGTLVAEAMGVPVHLSFRAARLPAGSILVGPKFAAPSALEAAAQAGADIEYRDTDSFSAHRSVPILAQPVPSPSRTAKAAPVSSQPIPSADVQSTLSRIEDVLDRDRLLPWLLNLAMNEVEADGGSLMLLDHRGDELFIAVAHGLSLDVQHGTRVTMGQGIAGRVAASGISEIVLSRDAASLGDERGALSASLCIPLPTEAGILGVLNLSRTAGRQAFDADHLAAAESLGLRAASILARAEGVARTREGELRQRLARHLMSLAEDAESLESALAGWSGALTMDLDADGASMAVLRQDGTLLLAESDSGGDTRVGTVPQTHPAWNDVLATGRSVIARQVAADGDDELTLFFLPVGRPHLTAVLGLTFGNAADAHRFQARSAAVVGLLERRLPGLMRRFLRRNQIHRQQELLAYMSDRRPPHDGGTGPSALTALRVAVARIVGARRTYLINGGELLPESAAPPAGWSREDWSRRARELMAAAGDGRWLSAGVDPGRNEDPDAAVLVVPAAGQPACGLILVGKERHDAGDSRIFSTFDAELAVRLAALLPQTTQAGRSALAETVPAAPVREPDLQLLLRREMDRADRYHVAFSVSAFRLPDDVGPDLAESTSRALERLVRSSDTIHLMPDGVTLVIAPEDTNAVSHLEHRVIELMRQSLGAPNLSVKHGRALYPGPFQTPDQLLAQAFKTLDSD